MLGLLGRLSLDYASGTGPSSVIAKLASPHEPVLDLVQSYGFYEREVNFYRHANGAIANIPRSYYADVDPSGRAFALVLEDLSHCRVPDQVAGCSSADATAVMQSVATMHARYWNIDSEPSFDWLPKGNEGTYRQGEVQHGMIYEPFLAAFGDRLSDTGRRVADLLRTKTLLMSDAAIARGPLTLVHMDMRLDNVLFDDDAADDSPSVFFIDWQLCTKGLGAQDVAYFLAWSMDDETRRAHTADLMATYHETLCSAGVKGYPYAQFEHDFRQSLLTVALMASIASIAIPATNQRGHDLMEAFVLRSYAAIDDMRAFEMFPD